jgi:anion-transporting  ArsA/GET3 family ATPase
VTARLTVVVGGGGVGKTTTAAALGLAEARVGRRVLVVTVDPARRLADALGVKLGIDASRVELDGVELWARMPDTRQSVDRFAEWLFVDPAALERVRQNGMYRELGDSLAGVHELVCVAFVDHELQSGRWDHVVLDTAPSRHALEFFDYPGRLARMLEARTLRWIAGLARFADAALEERPGRGLLAWGRRRVGALVGTLVGAAAIHDIAALFAEFLLVRERWLELVRRVEHRLEDPSTLFVVVTAPSGAALDDTDYLLRELAERRLSSGAVLLNRAVSAPPRWIDAVSGKLEPDSELAAALERSAGEWSARAAQTEIATRRLRAGIGQVPLCVLPALPSSDPRKVVTSIADAIATSVLSQGLGLF